MLTCAKFMACLLPPLRAHLTRRLAASSYLRSLSALTQDIPNAGTPPIVISETRNATTDASKPDAVSKPDVAPPPPKPPRSQLRAKKAVITLSSSAVARLRILMSGPAPRHLRIGVRNKGCAGMAYHLEYVDEPGRFDEVVEQDGVRVLVDSKALFSIIGSEMDWVEDRLSAKFAFKNPNVKDACGCGESFNI